MQRQQSETYLNIFLILFVFVVRHSLNLDNFPITHGIFSVARVYCWLAFFYMCVRYRPRVDKIGFGLLLYSIVVTISSIIHYTDQPFGLISDIVDIFSLWGICVIFLPKNAEYIIRTLIFSFCACIYLNFVLLLILPDGLWITDAGTNFYLLGGNYNQMGRSLIPAIALSGYCSIRYKKNEINFYILSIVSFVTLIIVGSKTSLVGISLLVLYYFIPFKQIRKWIFISFIFVYVLFQLVAVFLQHDLSSYTYITYFVENILHKDLTFTYRTLVWLKSIQLFYDSPILGYGYQSPEWYRDILSVTTTHNFLIDLLIKGGIILLLVFVYLIILSFFRYIRNEQRSTQYLAFSFITFLFMMIMEVYVLPYVVLLILLLSYSQYLTKPEMDTSEIFTEKLAL